MREFLLPESSGMHAWYIADSLCDEIIHYFEKSEMKERGVCGKIEYKPDVKDSTDVPLNPNRFLYERYTEELNRGLGEYMNKFNLLHTVGKFDDSRENTLIQKYYPNQGFHKMHCEQSHIHPWRLVVFMTYLNNVPRGGTRFRHQGIDLPCEKGLTVLWPAGYTHAHAGITNSNGSAGITETKYIVTGWLSYVE
tara:strand:- start:15252 stop:15833 length:582 start_codon:yes stop_codon:yes gene_type:complete